MAGSFFRIGKVAEVSPPLHSGGEFEYRSKPKLAAKTAIARESGTERASAGGQQPVRATRAPGPGRKGGPE